MNWCRNRFDASSIRVALADEHSDRCSHVEANEASAFVVHSEVDSFGPVGVMVACKGCDDKRMAAENAELVLCCDCKTKKPAMDTFEWTSFDFYAPQGDEALVVCRDCGAKPKHAARVAKDAAAARSEDDARRECEREDDDCDHDSQW